MAGTYTVQLAWVQKVGGGRPSGLSHCPLGQATDRLGTSGQIWKGSIDTGAWGGPAAKERLCSRAASHNSLLTANLQTREQPGCRTDFSLWPPAIALCCSLHVFLQPASCEAFKTSTWTDRDEKSTTYFFTAVLCALACSQE